MFLSTSSKRRVDYTSYHFKPNRLDTAMDTLNNNRGVIIVFFALFLFLLLIFLGVAVDIGWTTIVRTHAQRRVDAAALAGASQLSSSTVATTRQSNAQTMAQTFAHYNKVVGTSTKLFFSSIRNVFGASETGSTTINVSATAYLGCPGVEKPPLPLALCHSAVDPTNSGTCDQVKAFQTPDNNSAFFAPPGMTINDSNCKGLVDGSITIITLLFHL